MAKRRRLNNGEAQAGGCGEGGGEREACETGEEGDIVQVGLARLCQEVRLEAVVRGKVLSLCLCECVCALAHSSTCTCARVCVCTCPYAHMAGGWRPDKICDCACVFGHVAYVAHSAQRVCPCANSTGERRKAQSKGKQRNIQVQFKCGKPTCSRAGVLAARMLSRAFSSYFDHQVATRWRLHRGNRRRLFTI